MVVGTPEISPVPGLNVSPAGIAEPMLLHAIAPVPF